MLLVLLLTAGIAAISSSIEHMSSTATRLPRMSPVRATDYGSRDTWDKARAIGILSRALASKISSSIPGHQVHVFWDP